MPLNLETVKGLEEVATTIRERLKEAPVYRGTLNDIIKGCRILREKSDKEIVKELFAQVKYFSDIEQTVRSGGTFDGEVYAALRTYRTLLQENIPSENKTPSKEN